MTVYKPAGPISSSVADTVPTTVPIVIFSGCVIRYGFPPVKDANDGALSFTSAKKNNKLWEKFLDEKMATQMILTNLILSFYI